MLVLFDHGTPKGLARALSGHAIQTAQAKGRDTLSNGALLNATEEAGSNCYSRPTVASAINRTCKSGASPLSF